MSQRLREVLQNCSEGDELICTEVAENNSYYLTENKGYKVHTDSVGALCIIDDDGDEIDDVDSFFKASIQRTGVGQYTVNVAAQLAKQGNISDDLDDVLPQCSEGDVLECTKSYSARFTLGKVYPVVKKVTGYKKGRLCIVDDAGYEARGSASKFTKVQPIQYSPSAPSSALKPIAVMSGQVAPWDEPDDTPKSVVDGDYSEHDTWGIGNKPHKKVKQWKPDTIREDIDIMESIRHACNRT